MSCWGSLIETGKSVHILSRRREKHLLSWLGLHAHSYHRNKVEIKDCLIFKKHYLFHMLYSNYFRTVVAEQTAVLKAWSEWCPSPLDLWCWGRKHGNTCRRRYPIQCCCRYNGGLQSLPAWHSTQSHFSWKHTVTLTLSAPISMSKFSSLVPVYLIW